MCWNGEKGVNADDVLTKQEPKKTMKLCEVMEVLHDNAWDICYWDCVETNIVSVGELIEVEDGKYTINFVTK